MRHQKDHHTKHFLKVLAEELSFSFLLISTNHKMNWNWMQRIKITVSLSDRFVNSYVCSSNWKLDSSNLKLQQKWHCPIWQMQHIALCNDPWCLPLNLQIYNISRHGLLLYTYIRRIHWQSVYIYRQRETTQENRRWLWKRITTVISSWIWIMLEAKKKKSHYRKNEATFLQP
jgi:hypothetical protein